MICTPEEARYYSCCTRIGSCTGERCMGWVKEKIKVSVPGTENEIFHSEYTGKGYCGHIKH